MSIKSFRDIIAWQKAHQLVLEIYKITFPASELYGLLSQIRRASVSVPNNITEGMGRGGKKELIHFLTIARGSLEETRYLLILSQDLKLIEAQKFKDLTTIAEEVSKTLNGFIKALKR